jgi:methylenetetrahydrofolate reductase (NADPH)
MTTPTTTVPKLSISQMLRGYSIEVSPADSRAVSIAMDRLPHGTEVFLTWIPNTDPRCMVEPATKLRAAGYLPVPHIGARHLKSSNQLEQLAKRLVGDAGVDRVLVIGGDRERPAGPYESSLAVMETEFFQNLGVNRMAVAGFPEGHPSIKDAALEDALLQKVKFAEVSEIQLSIVSQFCFRAEPITRWLHRLRQLNIGIPVKIGLAGPAGLLTLTRFALRCGIGNSLRVLTEHPSFAKLLTEAGPAPIIRDLEEMSNFPRGDEASLRIAGIHLFVFGGIRKTIDWVDSELLA